MSRLSLSLAAVLSLTCCALAFSQTNGATPVRPGSATGTALPGMPAPGARAPHTGTARIRGRVVAAQTGAPLRRAQVTLNSPGVQAPSTRSASTDGDGRFEFTQLPAGRYFVTVSKTGYVALQNGQRRPTDPMTTMTLAEGDLRDGVDFALPRGGVIAVRVTDDFGDPLPGAQMQVQRFQYGADGQRRLNSVFVAGGFGMSMTDDRGEVRLYGLAPGDYVVSAMLRNQGQQFADPTAVVADGFGTTFHPGTINPNDAATVTVSLGEETSIEFAMSSARLARVSGTVVDSQGRPVASSFVNVVTRQGNGMFSSGGGSTTPDGAFTINGVPPGDYFLEVRTQQRPGSVGTPEFGSVPIAVAGAEITGIRVVTGKGVTLSGRVIFEGTQPGPRAAPALRVFPTPADPSRPLMMGTAAADPRSNGALDENGNFQLAGLSGRIFLTFTATSWMVKSITLDGEDITDEPLELTGKQSVGTVVIRVTDKVTRISGQVSDARGQRSRECTVVFQSAEAREPVVAARLQRMVRCDSTGSFQTRGMRPGRYVVTAITSVEQGRQFEPEYQEQLRRASESLTIREGETLTLDLKLASGL